MLTGNDIAWTAEYFLGMILRGIICIGTLLLTQMTGDLGANYIQEAGR